MSNEQFLNFDDILNINNTSKNINKLPEKENIITNDSINALLEKDNLNDKLSNVKNIINDIVNSELPRESSVEDINPVLGLDENKLAIKLNLDYIKSQEQPVIQELKSQEQPVIQELKSQEQPKQDLDIILNVNTQEPKIVETKSDITTTDNVLKTYKEVLSNINIPKGDIVIDDDNIAILLKSNIKNSLDMDTINNIIDKLRNSIITTGLNYIGIDKINLLAILGSLEEFNLEAFQIGLNNSTYYIRYKTIPIELETYQTHIFNTIRDRIISKVTKTRFSFTINLTNNGIPLLTEEQIDDTINMFDDLSYNCIHRTLQVLSIA